MMEKESHIYLSAFNYFLKKVIETSFLRQEWFWEMSKTREMVQKVGR